MKCQKDKKKSPGSATITSHRQSLKPRRRGKRHTPMSAKQTNLFSRRNKKNVSKCHLLKFVPRVLSVKLKILTSGLLFCNNKQSSIQ